jgi:hypothetical protein
VVATSVIQNKNSLENETNFPFIKSYKYSPLTKKSRDIFLIFKNPVGKTSERDKKYPVSCPAARRTEIKTDSLQNNFNHYKRCWQRIPISWVY